MNVSSNWGHERVFARFEGPCTGCAGSGDAQVGGDPTLRGVDSDADAVAPTAAGNGEPGAITAIGPTGSEDGRLAGGAAATAGGRAGRDARRALPVVGAGLRAPGESCDDESGDHSGVRVDSEKKSRRASERDEAKRGAWRQRTAGIEPGRLVWVDETGSNLGLTRTHSRAPRGARAFGDVPQRRGPNRTLITALTLDGFGPGLLLDEAIDRTTFDGYIIHRLVPTLAPGQIVVVDNLKVHYSDRARAAIEAQGAHLWYLPPYSPDLTPIEEAFSKVKAALRTAGPRTLAEHSTAIWAALRTITPQDAAGWFAHAGYLPAPRRSSQSTSRRRRPSLNAPPTVSPSTITLRIPHDLALDHLW